jgi:hypothetical protein
LSTRSDRRFRSISLDIIRAVPNPEVARRGDDQADFQVNCDHVYISFSHEIAFNFIFDCTNWICRAY